MLFRPRREENLSTRTNAKTERRILVEGKGIGKAKELRLGLGGVRIAGWVPGPQGGNLNLEPHPPEDETTSCVDRMTRVTQQREQPHAHGKRHDQRMPQSFPTLIYKKESAPAVDREWAFLMHELLTLCYVLVSPLFSQIFDATALLYTG